jgi:hypothetical protein
MKSFAVRYGFVVLVAVVAVALPRAAYSQQMSFSYYADSAISSDLQTLYNTINGYDNSSGCTHYSYDTYGYVYGPNGYYDQQYFSGLSAWMNAPFAEGNYSISSSVTVSCSCFGSGLGAGGGWASFGVSYATSYWQNPVPGFGYCHYTYLACSSGVATCGSGSLVSVQPGSGCTPYKGALHGVIIWGSEKRCTLGISWNASGPGHCT